MAKEKEEWGRRGEERKRMSVTREGDEVERSEGSEEGGRVGKKITRNWRRKKRKMRRKDTKKKKEEEKGNIKMSGRKEKTVRRNTRVGNGKKIRRGKEVYAG